MKRFSIQGLLLSILIFSCNSVKTPEEVFEGAKEKILSANRLSVNQLMLWESPALSEIDTISTQLVLRKNQDVLQGFDFLVNRESSALTFIDGVMANISHPDSTVMVYSDSEANFSLEKNIFVGYSPIQLLGNGPWSYLGDTSIKGKTYNEFLWIEKDTTIMDKKVLLNNHIFINPSNQNLDFYSRRLFHDGKKNQFIEIEYSNYQFSDLGGILAYDVPEGYVSKEWGQTDTEAAKVLTKGDLAPEFKLRDEKGNLVKLSQFKGKKVLLDFSMINCGWCNIAIEQFNKPDYEFAENIVPLYINPVDSKEKMDKYLSKVSIPFPVLVNAKEVGKAYGVSGYPTFYLIDENGKVEDVFFGFSDEQILKWRKGGV